VHNVKGGGVDMRSDADGVLGYENDRLRHIRLHEQVNELPDPNYATLKFFMGHLDRCGIGILLPCVAAR
jgi:hypothetical protein